MSESSRASRIARGGEILGYRKVSSPGQVKIGTVLTYIYDAKNGGKKFWGMYDANPEIVYLGLKRSQKGSLYMIGANTHYLERKVDRRKVILRMRTGTRLPSSLFPEMIHAYRLDRVVSPIYRAIDIVADFNVLTSEALWKYVNDL